MFSSFRHLLWIALPLAHISCGKHEPTGEPRASENTPIRVETVSVKQELLPETLDATGTVRSRATAVISSKTMGYIRQVHVRAGDTVRAGQLLVSVEANSLDANLRQAEAAVEEAKSAIPEAENGIAAARAQLELAEVTYKRMQDLLAKKSVSQQEFDEVTARRRLAQANLEMAQAKRAQLNAKIRQAEQSMKAAEVTRSYGEIYAPFAGTIVERTSEPGDLASPGRPLLTLEESRYRLEVPVDESRIRNLRLGQLVPVTLEALGRTLEARITEIVPAVDPASRSLIVKIDLPAGLPLRGGMFGRARFAVGERQAIAIPASALVERGQIASVFVIEDGRAKLRLVTPGVRDASRVEILSGLTGNETLVARVPTGLADGLRVEGAR
jgi:RND family efflux transporter MFP subunit